MSQKDYYVTATNNKAYNIRLCEIIVTGSESSEFDKLFIIYKTPQGEYLKRVKHFHPSAGSPEVYYEVVSTNEVEDCRLKKFIEF